ncbi:hypothetical protein LC586_19415 [Nostoc sp. CHAB 5714]|uniref:Uncharacterized protein n=1 Tax=Nostoc favosum CHAB5714 TaxID=2780399 RepID=A0ABS8IAU9_9NOSO|nr:hypothetical protein [Nostoc favosum CHAB5714]
MIDSSEAADSTVTVLALQQFSCISTTSVVRAQQCCAPTAWSIYLKIAVTSISILASGSITWIDSVIISAHLSQAIFDTFSFSAICYPSMGFLKYLLRINFKDQNAMSTTGYWASRILPESDYGVKAS